MQGVPQVAGVQVTRPGITPAVQGETVARTGSESTRLVLFGLTLVLLGTALVLMNRRRAPHLVAARPTTARGTATAGDGTAWIPRLVLFGAFLAGAADRLTRGQRRRWWS